MHNIVSSSPKLFAKLILLRKQPNFEKILYLESVNKGDVVFDVGANCGYFTTLFSKLVTSYGEVHAFEPVPETYSLLFKNTLKMPNVRLNNLAIGESRGKAVISYDLNDSEKATIVHSSTSKEKHAEINVISLDDYVEENNIRKIDFVKCDVEGFELNALKGMKKTLAMHLPQISIEVTLKNKEKLELINLLESLGYNTFRKIEKDFPYYEPKKKTEQQEDYFYLHATSSLST